MLSKIKEIVQAYAAAINPTEEQKRIAEERLKICVTCENWEEEPISRCKLCGCLTKGKVFSPNGPEACPAKKWTV